METGNCARQTSDTQGNVSYATCSQHTFSKVTVTRCNEVVILGVTFQCDSKFSTHVKNKLIKANKCLFILRSLRKEGYKKTEIDLLFNTLVLPNITYALSLYAASESDVTPVQCFLDRCFKRKFTSKPISVYSILEKQD